MKDEFKCTTSGNLWFRLKTHKYSAHIKGSPTFLWVRAAWIFQILSSSVWLDGKRWWTAIFRSLQRCSIGFKSGLWLGHSRTVTELTFFSISYNIDINHDINLPLMGKEMLTETFTHTYVAPLLLQLVGTSLFFSFNLLGNPASNYALFVN